MVSLFFGRKSSQFPFFGQLHLMPTLLKQLFSQAKLNLPTFGKIRNLGATKGEIAFFLLFWSTYAAQKSQSDDNITSLDTIIMARFFRLFILYGKEDYSMASVVFLFRFFSDFLPI